MKNKTITKYKDFTEQMWDGEKWTMKKTKYYALQAKDGHLLGTLTGKILVTTHKIRMKGYKTVELIIKK